MLKNLEPILQFNNLDDELDLDDIILSIRSHNRIQARYDQRQSYATLKTFLPAPQDDDDKDK